MTTPTNLDLFQRQNNEPHRSSAIGGRYCHSAGLGATILSSGVDVLAVTWVSVAFRATGLCCHSNSLSLIPLCSVRFFGVSSEFCMILRIGNHCMDSVAINLLSIVTVLVLFYFLLYATSYIIDCLSRIRPLPLVIKHLVRELFSSYLVTFSSALSSPESHSCTQLCPVTSV